MQSYTTLQQNKRADLWYESKPNERTIREDGKLPSGVRAEWVAEQMQEVAQLQNQEASK